MARRRCNDQQPATPALLRTRLYLTVGEFASLAGISAKTVYAYIKKGQVPAQRFGAAIRIRVADVLEQLNGKAGTL
jgi:excisionase family DNA binding protein